MADDNIRAVEDYTNAFLWMAGLVLFMALLTLWAVFGFAAPLVVSLATKLVVDNLR